MDPIAYSPEQAAFMAGCSIAHLRRAIRGGSLISYKRGRRRFVRVDDLDRWLSASDAEKAAATPSAAEVV